MKTKTTPSQRLTALQQWLDQAPHHAPITIQPLGVSAGISHRRYYRVMIDQQSYVAMDAAEDQKCARFVELAQQFRTLGVQTPEIYRQDLAQGFLLLTDFGDHLYYDALTPANATELYQRAFTSLLQIQSYPFKCNTPLAPFDMDLYRHKMSWFSEYYCQQQLGFNLTEKQKNILDQSITLLIEAAQQQPQVGVHYDYHSRNLMLLDQQQVGVLDFQDAVRGPISYDLIALLRDCYIDWPPEQVATWIESFRQQALQAGILTEDNPQQFKRWCDWTTLQRHLKCIGIFARLNIQTHQSNYLAYIPRSLNYIRQVSCLYPEFEALDQLLEQLTS